ncbi:hypothetical protein P154DRAFT_539728 [Amniculicola lignicola CBS 123094]|uniref:Uncharacterized protein n=1 Tax=Amniculicola lignicola CBS 123094 TaxID=1392246 RepID=A0A6A5VXK6_9PLEO|nr:hypothetical protein P154DRAFT_539728 [Amniculicola lignicola CBS 123094]
MLYVVASGTAGLLDVQSLDQRLCLSLLFENGLFKRLRPQPKTFGDSPTPRIISSSTLFERQQGLVGGASVLPLEGKRILAVVLATALLPFLETLWVQPSFAHLGIQFFRSLDGELPNITKLFLDMRQAPVISPNRVIFGNGYTEQANSHIIYPNASVLALENLKNLEADAGVDYYLATKACLQWEYLPVGEPDKSFESAIVQRMFYQNVIKRLEFELFRAWHLRSEDLNSLDLWVNEFCWGPIG